MCHYETLEFKLDIEYDLNDTNKTWKFIVEDLNTFRLYEQSCSFFELTEKYKIFEVFPYKFEALINRRCPSITFHDEEKKCTPTQAKPCLAQCTPAQAKPCLAQCTMSWKIMIDEEEHDISFTIYEKYIEGTMIDISELKRLNKILTLKVEKLESSISKFDLADHSYESPVLDKDLIAQVTKLEDEVNFLKSYTINTRQQILELKNSMKISLVDKVAEITDEDELIDLIKKHVICLTHPNIQSIVLRTINKILNPSFASCNLTLDHDNTLTFLKELIKCGYSMTSLNLPISITYQNKFVKDMIQMVNDTSILFYYISQCITKYKVEHYKYFVEFMNIVLPTARLDIHYPNYGTILTYLDKQLTDNNNYEFVSKVKYYLVRRGAS